MTDRIERSGKERRADFDNCCEECAVELTISNINRRRQYDRRNAVSAQELKEFIKALFCDELAEHPDFEIVIEDCQAIIDFMEKKK